VLEKNGGEKGMCWRRMEETKRVSCYKRFSSQVDMSWRVRSVIAPKRPNMRLRWGVHGYIMHGLSKEECISIKVHM
jgi:hypothetical protein